MTDDIVTRLRNSCDHLCVGCTEENAHDVGLEAAYEIESLRVAYRQAMATVVQALSQRDRWRRAAESLERDHGAPGYAHMAYEEQDAPLVDIWDEILDSRRNSDKLQGWIDEMVATDAEWVDAEDYDTSDVDTEYGYDRSDPEED